jgi:integrase/recombinase XerD
VTLLAPTLQAFFTGRLMAQKNASPHTIASYRDCLRLLICFTCAATGTQPSQLTIEQIDAALVGAFLDHLEHDRGVSIATRNTRLAAVHSLFRFAALRHPEHAGLISQVLAIPAKRAQRAIVSFLTAQEADALLASPDRSRRAGRRDHALLTLALQTGLRVSELTGLRVADVHLGTGSHVQCTGKGRKARATPLTSQTTAIMRGWLTERGGAADDPVFPGPAGKPLGTDAVRRLTQRHAAAAAARCPSLSAKTISPHVLRHSCAMRMLESGIDLATISLWLGHENIRSTQAYLHAHMALKEKALARTAPSHTASDRYQPPDSLLAFLEQL